ncbi:YegP family protein [Aquimarina gracilis]|uniref:YegP family protein n=1 Tax=Aquimarina gracilis TaxID=874422 RepID=A0ABU5ZWV8_9FLAO|nr:YegP family protein [Aquimarina gracilis]MEB3346361.1 YegP family protein [Aquimarina gracilis]
MNFHKGFFFDQSNFEPILILKSNDIMADPKFKIHKSNNGQYYFNLHAPNGQIIATSETYTTKQNCKNGIESVKTNAPIAEIEDVTNE